VGNGANHFFAALKLKECCSLSGEYAIFDTGLPDSSGIPEGAGRQPAAIFQPLRTA